jgi:hypothetical protein
MYDTIIHVYNTLRIKELRIPGASFANCFRELKSTSAASSSQYNQIIVKQMVGTVANKEVRLTHARGLYVF